MSNKSVKKKVRNVVFSVLSFVLALFLFMNMICVFTIAYAVNENAWIDLMNASNYYADKTEEIKNKLIVLGNAGGLKPEFFENVVDSIQVTNDTRAYMDAYFHGNDDVIDHTAFRQNFKSELERYIKENNAKADDTNVEYLVDTAEIIYSGSLEIPLFKSLSDYFKSVGRIAPIIITVLSLLSLVIVLILLFGNKWKHRAFKYYYFACAGTFLSLFAVAVFITVAGGFQNIVLESRALYNMAVSFGTSAIIAFWAFTAFFLIVSFTLYFVYANKRKKVFATD